MRDPAIRDARRAELVAAVRRGDDRAFEELYERYRKQIQAYVLGMVGDHGRAEDVTQEVFISALRRMRDTERPIAFKPWIYEIAKNACIDHFRRSRRAEEVPLENDDGVSNADRGALTLSSTPDLQVESKLQLDDLRGAFGGLSESHHEILVLRELEGLSYKEIGERMGMSRPVVESTLFRARRRLTEEYDELVSGRRCERVMAVITAEGAASLRSLGLREVAGWPSICRPASPASPAGAMPGSTVSTTRSSRRPLSQKIAARFPLPFLPGRGSRGRSKAAASRARTPLARVHALGRHAGADRRPGRTGTRTRAGRRGRGGAGHRRRRGLVSVGLGQAPEAPPRPAGRGPPPPARPRLRRTPAARARGRSIPSRPSAGCCPRSATHPARSPSCTSSCRRCQRCRCRACRSCR
jgi:RNA polymerase sigma factor (sigma-70 family)